jgi:hypothetical protein
VRHDGFAIAHDALGSAVQLREASVYSLSPAEFGQFDFVFAGSILAHLRDPTAALRAIRSVLAGELLSVDALSLPLTVAHPLKPVAALGSGSWPLWWVPNLAAYRALFGGAGLQSIECGRPFFLKRGPRYRSAYAEGTSEPWVRRAISGRLGNLHAWVSARPAAAGRGDGREQ